MKAPFSRERQASNLDSGPRMKRDGGPEAITIVLADDHHLVRHGLRTLLEEQPEFKIVGEAGDGVEAIKLVETLQPDVLVLDLMMGGMNGLEVTRQVCRRFPKTQIVILSMYGTEAYVLGALRAGARAYVLKEAKSDELVLAVRKAAEGHRYLSSSLSQRAIRAYSKKGEETHSDPYDTLTGREREVLHLAARGHTSTEIAKRLFISQRTVEAHRANMMQKLGLHSQTDLIRYALQKGILPPES